MGNGGCFSHRVGVLGVCPLTGAGVCCPVEGVICCAPVPVRSAVSPRAVLPLLLLFDLSIGFGTGEVCIHGYCEEKAHLTESCFYYSSASEFFSCSSPIWECPDLLILHVLPAHCTLFQFSLGLWLSFSGTHSVGLGLFLQLLQFEWWEFLWQSTSLTCQCPHQSPAWGWTALGGLVGYWQGPVMVQYSHWNSTWLGKHSTSRHSVSAPLLLEPCQVQELLALSLIQYLDWKWFLYLWDLNYLLIPRQAFRIWLCW